MPHTTVPIGTVVKDVDGYLKRKVSQSLGNGLSRFGWKFEHVRIWEESHGPVPRGFNVTFKDGKRENVVLENLEILSRADNMRRNSIHARRSPEMKEVIYALIALKASITKKEKKRGKKQIERSEGSPVRDSRASNR